MRHFQAKGIQIKKKKGIDAADIDKCMLIDRHYYAIASKKALKRLTELHIPMVKFEKFYFRRRLGRGRRGWQGFQCQVRCRDCVHLFGGAQVEARHW